MAKANDPVLLMHWLSVNVKRRKRELLLIDHDIARRMGCDRSFVTHVLQGDFDPSFSALVALANAVQLPFAELFRRPEACEITQAEMDGRRTRWAITRQRQEAKKAAVMARRQTLRARRKLREDAGLSHPHSELGPTAQGL